MSPSPGGLLVGVDRAAFVAALVGKLRSAGVATGSDGAQALVRALDRVGAEALRDRRQVYWLARTTLVRHPAGLVIFDAVFAELFDDAVFSLDPVAMRNAAGRHDDEQNVPSTARRPNEPDDESEQLPWTTLPRVLPDDDGSGEEAGTPLWIPQPSRIEAIADVPFDQLGPRDLAAVERWLDAAAPSWPRRRTRRMRPATSGDELDLRRTMELARSTGWEPLRLARRRPTWRHRRLVMICDVSQSMQPYTRAYLHLMRAISVRADGETFAFGTSLTRMTPLLAHRSIDEAVVRAATACTDRFGGTNIARSLRRLLHTRHGQSVRGAIVVIASDGWDSDPPQQMTAAMAALARRAHRILWLNPRASAAGYQPLVAGMAAALPYCDEFLPAARISDLEAVVAAMLRA